MTREPTTPQTAPRRGAALVVAVIILALVALLLTAIAWQVRANRRHGDRREHQLQADWLARSGVELAAARLLDDPAGYRGEAVEPIPQGRVRIEVQEEPDGSFDITSEASYPADDRAVVVRTSTRHVRRITDGDRVRLEVVAPRRQPDAPARDPHRRVGRTRGSEKKLAKSSGMVQTKVTTAAVPVASSHRRKFPWLHEKMDCIASRTQAWFKGW
jgi:hypothetical protein